MGSDAFLTSALVEAEWSASRPGHFTHRERAPGSHLTEGWVGPRADPDAAAKRNNPCLCPELKPGHPVRSSVTVLTELPRLICIMTSTIVGVD